MTPRESGQPEAHRKSLFPRAVAVTVIAVAATLALVVVAQNRSRSHQLPQQKRSLVMDPATSQLQLRGDPIRVIPGDIVAATVAGVESAREITRYTCTWETEESDGGFLNTGIGSKKKKVEHRTTEHVTGSVGNQITIQLLVPGSDSIPITMSKVNRALAKSPGQLALTGNVNRSLPRKPDGGATCTEVAPVPPLSYEVTVDITRVDR
jgi:hypothetical protein